MEFDRNLFRAKAGLESATSGVTGRNSIDEPTISSIGPLPPCFDYSETLKSKGGKWTDDDLDQSLANPKAYAQGTKMAFAGESAPGKRADIIAYLRTLSDNPKPLPALWAWRRALGV